MGDAIRPNILSAGTIGATPTDVVSLWNATAAAAGAQQYSPALRLHGEGWKTDATAASQPVDWRVYAQPVEGAANPTVNLLFQSSVNDAAFATRLTLGSDGLLTPGGNISLGANKLTTTSTLLKEKSTTKLVVRNLADSADGEFEAGVFIYNASLRVGGDGLGIWSHNADNGYTTFQVRDNGVGLVECARMVGAADPYFQIGRDDTGVALNAVTNMLVLQAGGGSGNEAAGQGFGLSVKLGNAASQVEERGSLDIVLQTATDASEDASWIFQAMVAGAMATVLSVGGYAGVAKLGFYATAPVALQTGVAVSAAGIHAALVNLGLITA